MKEIQDNIWNLWDKGYWIIVPTNGFIRSDGSCVMGRGLALEASTKFPELQFELGKAIKLYGNKCSLFPKYRIVSFPVKRVWWERANLALIEESTKLLSELSDSIPIKPIYIPKVGCGNGKLQWVDVKPILEKYLNDNFVICDKI